MAAQTLLSPAPVDFGFVHDWNGDVQLSSPLHTALAADSGVTRSATGDITIDGDGIAGGYLSPMPLGDLIFL